MDTLLLSLGYVLGAFALNAAFYLVGAGAWPGGGVDAGRRLSDRFLAHVCRYALGWVVAGFVGVLLGLAGWLHPAPIWLALAAFAIAGIRRLRARSRSEGGSLRDLGERARSTWRSLEPPVRLALLAALAFNALLAANIAVGALVPDSWQDSLWYHLTLPGQWLLRGDVAMFPRVMPSTYMLGAHAAYAAILGLGDEILLTSVLAQAMLLLMAAMVAAAWRMAGPRGGALAAGSVPALFGSIFAIAPFSASNDGVTALMLGASGWALLAPRAAGRGLEPRDALLAGLLGGGAVASKLIAFGYWLPAVGVAALWAALGERRLADGARAGAAFGAVACCAAFLVLAPWLGRGFAELGNPLMPLAPRAVEIDPEFRPVLRGYDEVPRFHAARPGETLFDSLRRNVAQKLRYAFAWPNAFAPIAFAAALAAFGRKEPEWRAQAFALAACWLGLFALSGHLELARYFGLSYPLFAPAVGLLFAFAARPFRGWAFAVAAIVLFSMSAGVYASRQVDVALFPTIDWPFRPLVDEEESLEWLGETEDRRSFAAFEEADDVLPEDAYVLVADQTGPYYLNRKALWAGYACDEILGDLLDAEPEEPLENPEEAAETLRETGVDYVMLARRGPNDPVDPRLESLEEIGALQPVPLPLDDDDGALLWRVVEEGEEVARDDSPDAPLARSPSE